MPQKLAANGYTHLLVRRRTRRQTMVRRRTAPLDGLRVAAHFDDGQVFAVTASPPAIYTATMTGFFPREHERGMDVAVDGEDAVWTIVNTRDAADRRDSRH